MQANQHLMHLFVRATNTYSTFSSGNRAETDQAGEIPLHCRRYVTELEEEDCLFEDIRRLHANRTEWCRAFGTLKYARVDLVSDVYLTVAG